MCEGFCLLQVYKVLVSVGQQEWFVFRRYAEFDKLYNTVSSCSQASGLFHLLSILCNIFPSFFNIYYQLRKQFPSMNLKIPAKRIFGDNFEPGGWLRIQVPEVDNRPMHDCVFQTAHTCVSLTEFIKQRRAGLHEFIKKIVSHPQLCNQ